MGMVQLVIIGGSDGVVLTVVKVGVWVIVGELVVVVVVV